MGIFDRWTSKKGKADKAGPSKTDRQEEAKRQAFASVPSGQPAPEKPPKAEGKNEVTSAPAADKSTDRAYRTLLHPIVTEKTGRQPGQYTFAVNPRATKLDVRNAVHQVYGIRPVAVNILNRMGQAVRYGRFTGQTVKRRKAIVTLPDGKTIDVNA